MRVGKRGGGGRVREEGLNPSPLPPPCQTPPVILAWAHGNVGGGGCVCLFSTLGRRGKGGGRTVRNKPLRPPRLGSFVGGGRGCPPGGPLGLQWVPVPARLRAGAPRPDRQVLFLGPHQGHAGGDPPSPPPPLSHSTNHGAAAYRGWELKQV